MPGHGNVMHYNQNAPNNQSADISRPDAYLALTCPHCGKNAMLAVVAMVINEGPPVLWARCTACQRGIVENEDQIAPSPKIGDEVEGSAGRRRQRVRRGEANSGHCGVHLVRIDMPKDTHAHCGR